MGTLIFICPGTRQTVSTGIEIDPASFSTLKQTHVSLCKTKRGMARSASIAGCLVGCINTSENSPR